MGNITFGQTAEWLSLIAAVLVASGVIYKKIKEGIAKMLESEFGAINNKLDALSSRIDTVDNETTKNFLVARLSELDRGMTMNEVEKERFWEQYDHYTENGGNSYIKRKVDELEQEGRLTKHAKN